MRMQQCAAPTWPAAACWRWLNTTGSQLAPKQHSQCHSSVLLAGRELSGVYDRISQQRRVLDQAQYGYAFFSCPGSPSHQQLKGLTGQWKLEGAPLGAAGDAIAPGITNACRCHFESDLHGLDIDVFCHFLPPKLDEQGGQEGSEKMLRKYDRNSSRFSRRTETRKLSVYFRLAARTDHHQRAPGSDGTSKVSELLASLACSQVSDLTRRLLSRSHATARHLRVW